MFLLDLGRRPVALTLFAACAVGCSSSSGYPAFAAEDGSPYGPMSSGGNAEMGTDEGGTDASLTDPGATFPPPPGTSGSDAMSCANLGCFDVFDCAIYHAAEFGPCGFTQCVDLVCK